MFKEITESTSKIVILNQNHTVNPVKTILKSFFILISVLWVPRLSDLTSAFDVACHKNTTFDMISRGQPTKVENYTKAKRSTCNVNK